MRITTVVGLVFAGLLSWNSAQALGPGALLHIQQSNDYGFYSAWSLTYNSSPFYSSSLKTKILNDIPAGTYKLSVVPPNGAHALIQLYRGSVLLREVNGTDIEIVLGDGDAIRAKIVYSYVGRIEVRSDPSGVPFTLVSGRGETYTGVTPAILDNMEPYWYRITYNIQAECEVQKTQARGLERNSTLSFYANFNCGKRPVATPGKTSQPLATGTMPEPRAEMATHAERPAIAIHQNASVSETLPGGIVRFTITVRNVTRSTLHDILVTETFDRNTMDIVLPVNGDGLLVGNEIAWGIPTLFAGQVWTTSFEGRVPEHLVSGDRVVLTARASGDMIDDLYPQELSSTVGVGIAYMPQTGSRLDILALALVSIGAALTTISIVRRKQRVSLTA